MGRLTEKEVIEGFKIDNALLGENESGTVERNNIAIKCIEELQEYRSICDSPEKLKLIDELYLERCEEINRLKAELSEKEEEFCEWEVWNEEADCYHTSCENAHFFVDGSPKDNKHVFCPYCGRKIKEVQDVKCI